MSATPKRIDLCTSLYSGAARQSHFFNGRLLTAETMRDEQSAMQSRTRALGTIFGEGVVRGLSVAVVEPGSYAQLPVVSVGRGTALSRDGGQLYLGEDIEVRLVPEDEPTDAGPGDFINCGPMSGDRSFTGQGLYVLVIGPEDTARSCCAPKSDYGTHGRITDCGKRYEEDRVQFRLLPFSIVDPDALSLLNPLFSDFGNNRNVATLSLIRNEMANFCLADGGVGPLVKDPWSHAAELDGRAFAGPLETLRTSSGMTDREVALALVYWTDDGVAFADRWSVRRYPPGVENRRPAASPFSTAIGSTAQARFFQFQDHLAWLAGELGLAALKSIDARDYFRLLPASGLLPWAGDLGSGSGCVETAFFSKAARRGPVFMNGSRLQRVLNESLFFPPIDVNEAELVWLYRVRESEQAIIAGLISGGQTSLVFSSGHMHWYGEARFDTARWDYANYV